jgi:protease I
MVIPFKQYEKSEFRIPQGLFEKAGFKVTVVSSQPGTATVEGDSVKVDLVIDALDVSQYAAIVFVGGYGVPEFLDNPAAHAAAQAAVKQNKVLGAICWAPIILANAGVLKGKKATASWQHDIITKKGGEVVYEDVVVDGNLVTGNGPGAAEKFGQAILEKLKK